MNDRQQAIREIQTRVRLKDVCASLGRETRRSGRYLVTLCPFHDDHHPSLYIYENPNGDQYHCYVCGEHGNIFDFVKKILGVDFAEALAWTANLVGLTVPTISKRPGKDLREYGLAVGWEAFKGNAKNKRNKASLAEWAKQRKITPGILEKAEVLYCSRVGLYKNAEKSSAEELESLELAGLLTKKLLGKKSEPSLGVKGYFEAVGDGAIVFPIHTPNGILTGFAFHQPDETKGPKYRFSGNFKKSETLYRLNQVWQHLQRMPDSPKATDNPAFDLYLVEGFMDALRLESLGENAAAILGNHLTSNQASLVADLVDAALRKGYTPYIHLFLDFDQAGQYGTEKSSLLLLAKLLEGDRIFYFDIIEPPSSTDGLVASDPDDFLKQMTIVESKSALAPLVTSLTDFLLARVLETHSSQLEDSWAKLGSAGRSQVIFRVQRLLKEHLTSPDRIFSVDAVHAHQAQGNNALWTLSLCEALSPFRKRDRAMLPANPSFREPHPDLVLALKKAACSRQTNEFPYDKESWRRLEYGGALVLASLAYRLGSTPSLQEPLMGLFTPKDSLSEPRLKAIHTPEDLIIQQYILLRLARIATTSGFSPGGIPAVISDRSGIKTIGPNDLVFIGKSGQRETVSFAYQIDAENINDPSKPLFKPYGQCWVDFNQYLSQKLANLKKAGIETIYPARLDIKGYYDNLPKYAVIDVLKRAIETCCPQYYASANELLVPHVLGDRDLAAGEEAEQISKWIEALCFGYEWYDPENGEKQPAPGPTVGIPQGPDLSAYVATIALFPLDKAMQEAVEVINERDGIPTAVYARYVDDIVIYAATEDDNRKLQETLSHQLQRLKLTLSDKTIPMEPMHVTDLWQWTIANRGFGTIPSIEDETFLSKHNLDDLLSASAFFPLDRSQVLSILHSPALRSIEQTNAAKMERLLRAAAKTNSELKHRDRVKFASHVWRLFAYRLRDDDSPPDWNKICEELKAKKVLQPFAGATNADLAQMRHGWFFKKYELLLKIEGLEIFLQSRPYLNPTIGHAEGEQIALYVNELVEHIGQNNFWADNFEYLQAQGNEFIIELRLAVLRSIIQKIKPEVSTFNYGRELEANTSRNHHCWLRNRLILSLNDPYGADQIDRSDASYEATLWHYLHAALNALIKSARHISDDSPGDPLDYLRTSILAAEQDGDHFLWQGLRLMLPVDQPPHTWRSDHDLTFVSNCVLSVMINCVGNDIQKLQRRNHLFKSHINQILAINANADWSVIMQPPTIVPESFVLVKCSSEAGEHTVNQLLELKFISSTSVSTDLNEVEASDSDCTWQTTSDLLEADWHVSESSQVGLVFKTQYRHSPDCLNWMRFIPGESSFKNIQALAETYEHFIKQLEQPDRGNAGSLLDSAIWTKWGIFQSGIAAETTMHYAVIEPNNEHQPQAFFWGPSPYPRQLTIPKPFTGYWRFGCALFDYFGLGLYLPHGYKDDYSALSSIGQRGPLKDWLIDTTIHRIGRLLAGRYHLGAYDSATASNRPHSVTKAFDLFAKIKNNPIDDHLQSVDIYLTLSILHLRSELRARYLAPKLGTTGLEAFRMVKFAEEFFYPNNKLFEYFHKVAPPHAVQDNDQRLNRACLAWQQAAGQIARFRDLAEQAGIKVQTQEYDYLTVALLLKSLVCQMREVVLNVLTVHRSSVNRLKNQVELTSSRLLAFTGFTAGENSDNENQWAQIVSWFEDEVYGPGHQGEASPLEKITPSGWLHVLYVLASEFGEFDAHPLDEAHGLIASLDELGNDVQKDNALKKLRELVMAWQSQIDSSLGLSRSPQQASNLMIRRDDGLDEGSLKISILGRSAFVLEFWAIHYDKFALETTGPTNPTSYIIDGQSVTFYWTEVRHQDRTISMSLTSRSLDCLAGLVESCNYKQPILPKIETSSEDTAAVQSDSVPCAGVVDGDFESLNQTVAIPEASSGNQQKDSEAEGRRAWSFFRQIQEKLWEKRKGRHQGHIRVAFFQWNLDDSYQWPGVEHCDKQTRPSNGAQNFWPNCSEHRRRRLVERVYEVCKKFNVDALLLPEYSLRPETVAWLAGREEGTNYPKGGPAVWAGTYRLYPQQIDFPNLPTTDNPNPKRWPAYSSVLTLVDSAPNNSVKQRLKRYPSIAANELFFPSDDFLAPLASSPVKGDLKASNFIMELICSENFILTSPLNAPFAVQAVCALQNQLYGTSDKGKVSDAFQNDLKKIATYLTGLDMKQGNDGTRFAPSFYPRRSILFVPAMSTRVEDFIALGLANLLSISIVTIICNAVHSNSCGNSCLIGPDAQNFSKNGDNNPLPLTPYNGLSPGIYTGNQYGGPLGNKEEALVIVDIDPFNPALPKPRPVLWPPPVKLVAHLPLVEWYEQREMVCAQPTVLQCKKLLNWNLKPSSHINECIEAVLPFLTAEHNLEAPHSGPKAEREKISNVLCRLAALMDHSSWQHKKMETYNKKALEYPIVDPIPALFDWIDCEIDLATPENWPKTMAPPRDTRVSESEPFFRGDSDRTDTGQTTNKG